jgi:hypothetical protein
VVAGESSEAGNLGTLGRTKERAATHGEKMLNRGVFILVDGPARQPMRWKKFRSSNVLPEIATFPFVIPSEA